MSRGDIGDAIWPEWRRRAEDEWKKVHSTVPQEEGIRDDDRTFCRIIGCPLQLTRCAFCRTLPLPSPHSDRGETTPKPLK